jgi:ribosomal protein S18 acetylase RimI-like enzyme
MNIRKVKFTDLDQLAMLFDAYRVFYKKESDLEAAKKFLSERITQSDSEIFVAAADGNKLVGFVQLYPLFSSTRMKKLWLLNDLYVLPSHRGQGISKLLIEEAKDLCRRTDACGMMLETAKSNEVGNSLYPAAGFELDGEHNYYEWDNLVS